MMITSCNIPLSSPSKIEGAGGSMTTFVKRILCTIAIIIAIATGTAVHAKERIPWTHGGPLLPDSSNFVTASLLVASPGEALYSSYGHCALRMECPVHNLDYCFSFEMKFDNSLKDYVSFFAGNVESHIIAVPTIDYVDYYKKEGRGIKQYELNLSTLEKQELWRALDNDYIDEQFRKYNLIENNCSSILFATILNAPIDRKVEFGKLPEHFDLNNGQIVRHDAHLSPWTQFLDISFLGTESDNYCGIINKISPESFGPVIKSIQLVDETGSKTPLFKSEKEILPVKLSVEPTKWNPVLIFAILLAIVVVVTILNLMHRCKKLGTWGDITLLVLQAIIGLMLIYTSFVSGLFGKNWNWYLIPFNPLPLIIWLIWRKRKAFYKVYLFYTVVLVLFILATPLSEQLDLPHQLITASLAVRCLYNYYDGKQQAAAVATTKTKKKTQKNKK